MAKLAAKQDQRDAKQVAESTAPKGKLATALFEDGEKWIQKAVNPKTKGNLHKALHVAQGETIPKAKIAKATHSKNPKLRHMAQFAKNVAKEDIADEGNEFTGNLAKAKAQHKDEFEVDGKKYKVVEADPTGLGEDEMDEGFKEMDAWLASREKAKGTGKFDKKKISTGTVYTRKPETFDDPETDPEATGGAPKRVGRPKGKDKGPERVTAKAWKHKDGRKGAKHSIGGKMHEDDISGEYDDEGAMAKGDMHTVIRHAEQLEQHLKDSENLPTWVIEKIGQIKGMMTSVSDYIISSHERGAEQATGQEGMHEPELDEEKVEAGKREFFDRLAPAAKKAAKVIKVMSKGKEEVEEKKESTAKKDTNAEKAGKKVAKDIEYDEGDKAKDDNRAEKAGKKVTKDIEYDDKKDAKEKKTESAKPDFLDVDKDGNKKEPFKKAVKDKEEKVDETTTSGSVATAPTGKSSKGGMQFGKGVYENLNAKIETMITESISVASKMEEDGNGGMAPTLTIQADGEEAAKLMMLLKLAGLENQIPKSCPTCGGSPCGCAEVVDENSPDWPTDPEIKDADPNLRTYSGGLNGPKSTGQSTTPVLASQLRRQASMEEGVKLERSLFNTWKNYKG